MSDGTPTPVRFFHIGAQNDALYIISGKKPSQNNDYPRHDADRTCIAKVFDEDEANRLISAANAHLSEPAPNNAQWATTRPEPAAAAPSDLDEDPNDVAADVGRILRRQRKSMSDDKPQTATPRTDAAFLQIPPEHRPAAVPLMAASAKLERELAEARDDFDIMKRSRDHEHRERLAHSAGIAQVLPLPPQPPTITTTTDTARASEPYWQEPTDDMRRAAAQVAAESGEPAVAAPRKFVAGECPRMTVAAAEGRGIEEGCFLERELAESRRNADDWMQKYGSTQGHSAPSSIETMRGLLRGTDSLLRRCLRHGLLRAEAENMVREIEAALSSCDKRVDDMRHALAEDQADASAPSATLPTEIPSRLVDAFIGVDVENEEDARGLWRTILREVAASNSTTEPKP